MTTTVVFVAGAVNLDDFSEFFSPSYFTYFAPEKQLV